MKLLGLIATVTVLSSSCATTRGVEQSSTPVELSELEKQLFDNGLDVVEDLDKVQGIWRQDWSREMGERVKACDAIFVVQLDALRTVTDPDQKDELLLAFKVKQKMFGAMKGSDITLIARESDIGYPSVQSHGNSLMEKPFLALLKWETAGENQKARWHLSPATESNIDRTIFLLGEHRDLVPGNSRRRVVVHKP